MNTSSSFKIVAVVALIAAVAMGAVPVAQAMGNNGGGVLMVHFDRTIRMELAGQFPSYYFDQFYDAGYGCDPLGPGEDCEDYRLLHPCTYGADLDPALLDVAPSVQPPMMWVVAVFPDTTCVEIAAVEFGLGEITGSIEIGGSGTLAQAAFPSPGWPGSYTGIRYEFNPPLTSHEVPLCYISGQPGMGGARTALAPHPNNDYILFWDTAGNVTRAVIGPEPCPYAVGSWNNAGNPGCNPDVPMTFNPMVCCLGDECRILTEDDCLNAGGQWHPDWDSCTPNPCLTLAACCFENGDCSVTTEGDCATLGGVFHADWTSCDPNPCPQPAACCVGEICSIVMEEECGLLGGEFHPEWPSCEPNPCEYPRWACCFSDGSCQLATAEECDLAGGILHTEWGTCTPNPCPPVRACCIQTGPGGLEIECQLLTEANCALAGGSWHIAWTSCDPNPCLPPVAVCCTEEVCEILPEVDCSAQGGTWYATLDTCDPNPCEYDRHVCCFGETCAIVTVAECLAGGGGWYPLLDSCDRTPASCRAARAAWARCARSRARWTALRWAAPGRVRVPAARRIRACRRTRSAPAALARPARC